MLFYHSVLDAIKVLELSIEDLIGLYIPQYRESCSGSINPMEIFPSMFGNTQ